MKDFHIIVGTPGVLTKTKIQLKNIKTFVLDEADEFLLEGYVQRKQVCHLKLCVLEIIFSFCDYINICIFFRKCLNARIFFFSATFEKGVEEFVTKFMGKEPEWKVTLEGLELKHDNLLQFYIEVDDDKMKEKVLQEIYENTTEGQTLLFCKVC